MIAEYRTKESEDMEQNRGEQERSMFKIIK
jgi:hypothetical protein